MNVPDDCIYDKAGELIASYDAGHVMASHTWSHADITKLSESELHTELEKVEVALKKILGIKPKLFRPPYGNYDNDALRVLKDSGYSSKCRLDVVAKTDLTDIDSYPVVYGFRRLDRPRSILLGGTVPKASQPVPSTRHRLEPRDIQSDCRGSRTASY